jgi:regulatory protein
MPESFVYEKLINASLRYVSFRPRSEKEFRTFLIQKLKKSKTYAAPLVERAIARMRELGYVDDMKFALWWIEQRQSFKPKGKRLVILELGAKGVSPRVSEAAFSSLNDTLTDPVEAAKAVLGKKLNMWRALDVQTLKKKSYDFLYRRGYDADTIGRVVDDLVQKD